MNKTLPITRILACLVVATTLTSVSLSGDPTETDNRVPLSERAVETLHSTPFTFNSPLIRITTVYGVSRQTFVKDTQNKEMMAASPSLFEGAGELHTTDVFAEMSPYGYDPARDTERQFESTQNRYLTSVSDQRAESPEEAQTSQVAHHVAAEDLPKSLNDHQQDVFDALNQPKKGKLLAKYHHQESCVPPPVCKQGDSQCQTETEDYQQCTELADQSDQSNQADQEDQCTDSTCGECAECEVDEGLLAVGSYGSGGAGGGGYSGFGGGGGGGGGLGGVAQANANSNTVTKVIIKVVVPEPSTYLTLGGMTCLAGFLGKRRRLKRNFR